MVRNGPLLFPIRGFAYLLRHVARLTFFAGLHGPALIPISQQVVGLPKIRCRRHRLMTVQAEIRLLEQTRFHRLMGQILYKVFVGSVECFSADLILRLGRMLRAIHVLDQMALAAGHAVQRGIAPFGLIHK